EAYRRRFSTYSADDEYIQSTLRSPTFGPSEGPMGMILVLPTKLEARMITTSDPEEFRWLDPNKVDFKPSGMAIAPTNSYLLSLPEPSPKGLRLARGPRAPYQEVHRNGCIEYGMSAGWKHEMRLIFGEVRVTLRLLHTLQFASMVYEKCNYFGDVKIILSIKPTDQLFIQDGLGIPSEYKACQSPAIFVEREVPTSTLEANFSQIAADIMNQVFNYFGEWKSPLFDPKGNYLLQKLQ